MTLEAIDCSVKYTSINMNIGCILFTFLEGFLKRKWSRDKVLSSDSNNMSMILDRAKSNSKSVSVLGFVAANTCQNSVHSTSFNYFWKPVVHITKNLIKSSNII